MTSDNEVIAEGYLILSLKWSGKNNEKYATWYRDKANGYVWSIDHAGVYTKEEADDHAYHDTIAVPASLALKHATKAHFEKVEANYLSMDDVPELLKSLEVLE